MRKTALRSRPAKDAGFHRDPSISPREAETAPPRPTDRAPTGTSRKVAVSAADPAEFRSESGAVPCASASRATRRRKRRSAAPSLVGLRFIDQQDRNVIFYPVLKMAPGTSEFLLLETILQLASTLRADEDLQQGRIE